jgi:hypothetical protein
MLEMYRCVYQHQNGFVRFHAPISKWGPATKMGPAIQFLQYFHAKSTRIDEKLYDDPFQIMWIEGLEGALLEIIKSCRQMYVRKGYLSDIQ